MTPAETWTPSPVWPHTAAEETELLGSSLEQRASNPQNKACRPARVLGWAEPRRGSKKKAALRACDFAKERMCATGAGSAARQGPKGIAAVKISLEDPPPTSQPLPCKDGRHLQHRKAGLPGRAGAFHLGGWAECRPVDKKGAGLSGGEEKEDVSSRAQAQAACTPGLGRRVCAKRDRDKESLKGRKEARFQRGLNPTQRRLGLIQ